MIQNNVLMFYERHKVELPFQIIPTGRTHEENRYFVDKEEVRKALEYSSVRNKAIILVQCSSGMGTAELLSIKTKQFWDGLDENGIVALKMIRKRTGQPFITFLTPEASEAVKLYLEDYDGEYYWSLFHASMPERGYINPMEVDAVFNWRVLGQIRYNGESVNGGLVFPLSAV